MSCAEPGHAGLIAVDLHVHTWYSADSLARPEAILRAAERRGLGAIAITDHNCIAGAFYLRERASMPVIVGEEIRTAEGEIIGLFLREEIPAGLTLAETVAAIREQGGLIYIPHPADTLRRSTVSRRGLLSIIHQAHMIEAFNARVLLPRDNQEAQALAHRYRLPVGAGSDAHTATEVGRARLLLPPWDWQSPASFLEAARAGKLEGRLSAPIFHGASTLAKLLRRFGLVPQQCPRP
jgi:predicted metal-dependent phosphoesterase TrpH